MRSGDGIVLVESASARIRASLAEICREIADTSVFASLAATRMAIVQQLPAVVVLGTGKLSVEEQDFVAWCQREHRLAVLICAEPGYHAAALRVGALEIVSRDARGLIDLQAHLRRLCAPGAKFAKPDSGGLASLSPPSLAGGSCPSTLMADTGSMATTVGAREPVAYQMIVFGASTGGTDALADVLSGLPKEMPGMVVAQHLPARHTGAFAERLNHLGPLRVREAREGDRVESGLVLIAPGGFHCRVRFSGHGYLIEIIPSDDGHRYSPSADVLFESVAREVGAAAIGVLMTGIGDDGAAGLLAMRNAGAKTIAQDQLSSAVYGMPRRAAEIGAAREIVPLSSIAGRLAAYVTTRVS